MKNHPWRFALLALAGGAVLIGLGWHSRDDFLRVLRHVIPAWLLAAVAVGIALNAAYGLLFDGILTKYTHRTHRLRHVAAYLMSQPGKYLPGKLWQAVMQSIALSGQASVTSVGIANIELSLVAVLHATGLGLSCLLFSDPPLAAAAFVATVLTGWILVRIPSGKWLLAALPRASKWLGATAQASAAASTRSSSLLALTVATLAANFIASWCLLAAAHTSLSTIQLAHLLASLWLGIAASLLALPIPAGLGVREAAVAGLGSVLAPDVPVTMLISIALLARCWQLLVDMASVAVGWMLWRATRHSHSRSPADRGPP